MGSGFPGGELWPAAPTLLNLGPVGAQLSLGVQVDPSDSSLGLEFSCSVTSACRSGNMTRTRT